MRTYQLKVPAVVVIAGFILAACGSGSSGPASSTAVSNVGPCQAEQIGPRGEKPTAASTLVLSDDEVAKVKSPNKKFRVATFWQVQANTGDLMLAGLRDTWAKYGLSIEISNVAYANWDAARQTNQIETLAATKPDAMVGILVDPVAVGPAIKRVNDAGIPLVFWDLPADGSNFTAIVTSNGRLAGCRAADAMAERLHGKGKIAVLPLKFAFFPTDQRVQGFKDRINSAYPNIKIVSEQGATVFDDAQKVGEALLQRYPDLNGVFASWQDPAMGVVAAARTVGRTDVVVTTVDLSDTAALEIARCGILKAAAAQLPYDEGVAEAKLVVKVLAKSDVPQYTVTDTPLASHDNVFDVYKQVFHQDAPDKLKSAFVQSCK